MVLATFNSGIYQLFLYLHILSAIIGKPVVKFSQGWLSAAMALYIVAIAISHAVMIPGTKKMGRLLTTLAEGPPAGAARTGPPPEVAEVEALGRRLGIFGAILNLMVIIILFLMVVKPGLNTIL